MTVPDGQGQQQGGGQIANGQQQQGQQQGQQQQQGTQTPPPVDTNAIAAAARRDGETGGYSNAERDLGMTISDAKNILADAKKRADADKTASEKLTERETELQTAQTQASDEKKRADRYEKIIQANVDAQLKLIEDEAISELLSGMDVGGQFDWLTKHGAKYVKAPEGQQQDGQQQGQQQADGQQHRAPDATQQQAPGLTPAGQQFNDLLRQRGLSTGLS
jgi:hypothetical protein